MCHGLEFLLNTRNLLLSQVIFTITTKVVTKDCLEDTLQRNGEHQKSLCAHRVVASFIQISFRCLFTTLHGSALCGGNGRGIPHAIQRGPNLLKFSSNLPQFLFTSFLRRLVSNSPNFSFNEALVSCSPDSLRAQF